MFATSWVCAQVWSKAEHFRWELGQLATREEAAVATKNIELVPSLCLVALGAGGV